MNPINEWGVSIISGFKAVRQSLSGKSHPGNRADNLRHRFNKVRKARRVRKKMRKDKKQLRRRALPAKRSRKRTKRKM